MIKKSSLSKILRILMATLDDLDEQEIEQLINGKGRLVYMPTPESATGKIDLDSGIDAIVQQLNGCSDREQARNILATITNRDTLAALARAIKIHVIKSDRREDIEKKIIEFVIGGRLRSQAIQNLNLGGG